jgi:hypothetical protein
MAMLGNNLSQLGVSAAQLDNYMQTTSFMLNWLPTTKEFGYLGTLGDFDHHEHVAIRLGGRYMQSTEDRQEQPGTNSIENSQIRLTDGSIIFTPDLLGPGITVETVHYTMVKFSGQPVARKLDCTNSVRIFIYLTFRFRCRPSFLESSRNSAGSMTSWLTIPAINSIAEPPRNRSMLWRIVRIAAFSGRRSKGRSAPVPCVKHSPCFQAAKDRPHSGLLHGMPLHQTFPHVLGARGPLADKKFQASCFRPLGETVADLVLRICSVTNCVMTVRPLSTEKMSAADALGSAKYRVSA